MAKRASSWLRPRGQASIGLGDVIGRKMRWASVLALAMASLGLPACGGGGHGTTTTRSAGHYSPQVQANVLRTCEAAAGDTSRAIAACKCSLAHLEARVPQDKLAAVEQAILNGKVKVPAWLRNIATGCGVR